MREQVLPEQQQAQRQQHATELASAVELARVNQARVHQIARTLNLADCPPLKSSEAVNVETLQAWSQDTVTRAGEMLDEDAKQGSLDEQAKAILYCIHEKS